MWRSSVLRVPLFAVVGFLFCWGSFDAAEQEPHPDAESASPAVKTDPQEPVLGVDWTVDRMERTGRFRPDAPFRIVNHFGDIRLRASDSEELLVIGAAQYSLVDQLRPVLDIRETDDAVIVEVRFPHPKKGMSDFQPDQVGRRRVDLAVMVPGLGAVAVDSLDGLVECKGISGPLTIESLFGALRIFTKNGLDIHSVHGDVEVYFKGIESFPELAVTTLTGDIRIEFPAEIDRTIRAETNGHLVSDFTMTVEKAAGSPHKVSQIVLGAGGDMIPLTSNLGTIFILDQPRLTKPGS